MAPTICLTDHVASRREKASPYFCRRTFQLKRDRSKSSNASDTTLLQNSSSTWRPRCPTNSSMSVSHHIKKRDESEAQLTRRKGLINLIIRTLCLMRRNQLLQQRVDALRAETQEFIKSVMDDVPREDENSSTCGSSIDESIGSPLSVASDSISLVSSQDQEDQLLSEFECTSDEAYHSSNTAQFLDLSSDTNPLDDF